MQEASSRRQDKIEPVVRGLMIMAGSVLAIIGMVAIPVFGEALFAGLFYGKSVKRAFQKESGF